MEIIRISSRSSEKIKQAVKIRKSPSYRQETGLFFAEGIRLCHDLAQNYRAKTVFANSEYIAENPGCPIAAGGECFLTEAGVMEKLCETQSPQGLACLFYLPREKSGNYEGENVLICENIQDPSNVGALLRSAAALGFGSVALCGNSADPYSQKALRASMGAIGRIALESRAELEKTAGSLHEKGYTIYAAALNGAKPVKDSLIKKPFALLVGNEGRGLSQKALSLADEKIYIAMENGVESLNAGVAGALLMYHMKLFGG